MKRREFVTLLAGAAASMPLAARAQQADKLPTIGILGSTSAAWNHWLGAFVLRLRELGWIENLSPYIAKDSSYAPDDLIAGIKGALTYNSNLYAVPFYGESSMLMYRKDLLSAVGVTTWPTSMSGISTRSMFNMRSKRSRYLIGQTLVIRKT